jgi:Bacterial membrane protein YfhO
MPNYMNSSFLKKALPHIIAIGVFLIVAVVYCRPALEGKVVNQSDVQQYKAMAQQSFEYKEKYGHFPLWTNSTFGGMPAYTIAIDGMTKLNIGYLTYPLTLGLPQPINFFFLACVCFYILMVVLRVNPWVGTLAALAYAYCSYDPVIIGTGHVTKMWAIGYAPGVVAAFLLLLQRHFIWGTALLAFFFAAQLSTQHLQIVYYTVISMALLALFYVIQMAREGQLKDTFIAFGLAAIACGIGYGTSVGATLPDQEYVKETMRGGRTELTNASKNESKGGLSKTYAFGWSYGIGETLTLLVPDSYGGGSLNRSMIGDNSKMADRMSQELSAPQDTGLGYANGYAYWGPQPGTSGPVYLGAVICLLCIYGLVILKGWPKWWLLSTIIVGIVLAWGKNFSAFNYFLFDHFPYYNKFRSPSTALFLPQLAAPILAALGLNQLLAGKQTAEESWKQFRLTAYVTGALLVLCVGMYFTVSYQSENDSPLKEQFVQAKMRQLSQGGQPGADTQQQALASANNIIRGLQADRQSVFGSDLLRTILLIVVAAALLGLFIRKKINQIILLAGLLVLSSYDLLAVSARYLNAESYVDQSDLDVAQAPTPADQQIKADPDKGYRVFDESSRNNPFEDSRASYFHNSLGGYSPAKLGLYQDLIDNQLSKGNMQAYNMLNTKYFIQADQRTGQPVARLNAAAFGPCWLVKAIHYVKDGDEEMKALDSINVRDTAIIQQQFASRVKFMPVADSTASIRLVDNLNDKINYKFSSKTNQFAVFSEVYYDKGWNVYLDGNKTDYLRVDYLLRGMAVPAGDHAIEFRFEPHSYQLGLMLTSWFSLAIYVLLIAGLVMEWRKRK